MHILTLYINEPCERVHTARMPQGQYYEAECIDVDPVRRVIHCKHTKPFKNLPEEKEFEVPYDMLVVSVSNT